MHLLFTKKALRQIKSSVRKSQNEYEVGGILLGYNLWYINIVVAVTYSNNPKIKSRTNFILDGAEHSKKANDIINDCVIKPELLGVWHSHTRDVARFSDTDRKTNKFLAQMYNGIISVIVTDYNTLDINAFKIRATNEEDTCKVWYLFQ